MLKRKKYHFIEKNETHPTFPFIVLLSAGKMASTLLRLVQRPARAKQATSPPKEQGFEDSRWSPKRKPKRRSSLAGIPSLSISESQCSASSASSALAEASEPGPTARQSYPSYPFPVSARAGVFPSTFGKNF